jgi:hypothetical protein
MNRMKKLLSDWGASSQPKPLARKITVQLTMRDAGRIRALAEIYPGHTQEQIASELLATALDELEEALPYIPGKKVIAEDEFGDPVYEDIGLTPRFEALTRKYSD